MRYDSEELKQATDKAIKHAKELKIHYWQNKENKVVLLFIIAVILIGAFTWHQYARRNYSFSSWTQKTFNHELEQELLHLKQLQKKVKVLQAFEGQSNIDDVYAQKIETAKIKEIEHEGELLLNCSRQYHFDNSQLDNCQKLIDDKIVDIETVVGKAA